MRTWDMILVNGDSYSALSNRHRVYSQFIADALGVECDNVARLGSNNDRIIRSTIESVLYHVAQGRRPLLILGMSFVMRQEVWVGDIEVENPELAADVVERLYQMMSESYPEIEDPSQLLPTITLDWLSDESRWQQQFRHTVEDKFYPCKKLLDLYVDLFMLTEFLRSNGVPYIIFSAADNLHLPVDTFPAIAHLQSVKSVMADPHVIEMHTNCVKLWAQSNDPHCRATSGHLSESGHQLWAQRMIRLIGEHHGS